MGQHTRWSDPLNGDAPWWARFFVRYGIGTAFAVFLLWVFVTRIDRNLAAMSNEHQLLMFYGRAQCLNIARLAPDDQRGLAFASCLPPRSLVDAADEGGGWLP